MPELPKKRPEFRNINLLHDVSGYRLPLAGWASILHRVSGLLLFILMPFIIWMFDTSLTSEISFETFSETFAAGAWFLPGWFIKLVALALIWAFLHHLCCGVRFLGMDVHHTVSKQQGRRSAVVVLVVSLILTVLLGAKLFGLY